MPDSAPLPQIVTAAHAPSAGVPKGARLAHYQSRVTSDESQVTILRSYYDALFAAHGPQHWWPGGSRFEVIVGAILTQNTSWKNVERAIANLRSAKLLSPGAIHKMPAAKLASCLRPSGYFRQKTRTLKTFAAFLFAQYQGSLSRLFATPVQTLRPQLLALRGIGPETADCILLYAGRQPVFVVDTYARRILERHDLLPEGSGSPTRSKPSRANYERIRALFESQLPRDSQLFNEFHALIVHTGKSFCFKSNPNCEFCPLARFPPPNRSSQVTSHQSPVTSS